MGLIEYMFRIKEADQNKEFLGLGFSQREADSLKWMTGRMNQGKALGLGAAGVYLYLFFSKNKQGILGFKFSPIFKSVKVFGTLFLGVYIGDYITNFKRKGGNSPMGNLYTNNLLNINKERLAQDFYFFNRKFTQEEVNQFLYNEKLKSRGPKKYNYNPYIHFCPEEVHKKKFDLMNKSISIAPLITDQIIAENSAKFENRDSLELNWFDLSRTIDKTGSIDRMNTLGLFNKSHVI